MNKHFFIIGGQRCGTTLLYRALDSHPEIEMAKPVKPEPKYFLNPTSVSRGLGHYQSLYFPEVNPQASCGEKSTSYIESDLVAKRISTLIQEAKILVLVRDPKQRAISNYRFSKDNGIEKRDINDAFLNEDRYVADYKTDEISVCPFAYLERGRYINYLKSYLDHFPVNQIKVLPLETLVDSQEGYQSILQFLGVGNQQIDLITTVNSSMSEIDELYPETKEKLNQYFMESNKELEAVFQVDISTWDHAVRY